MTSESRGPRVLCGPRDPENNPSDRLSIQSLVGVRRAAAFKAPSADTSSLVSCKTAHAREIIYPYFDPESSKITKNLLGRGVFCSVFAFENEPSLPYAVGYWRVRLAQAVSSADADAEN